MLTLIQGSSHWLTLRFLSCNTWAPHLVLFKVQVGNYISWWPFLFYNIVFVCKKSEAVDVIKFIFQMWSNTTCYDTHCQDRWQWTLFYFSLFILFYFTLLYFFFFLFLEQLELGFISHAVTSVTRLITRLGRME